MEKLFVCIIMLLLLSIGTVYAHEVNFEYETKISDYGRTSMENR